MSAGDQNQVVLNLLGGGKATAEDAATAFLAFQLRQAKGWLATDKAALIRRGRPRWSYNFGFPAASLNDAQLRARYERCAAAAISLADEPVAITLATVKSALSAASKDASRSLERHGAALHPEIAAAVAGFADSIRREDGLYALVDVGGGTVDCCTFNLFKSQDGVARCPIFLAHVELLGVDPWRVCERDSESSIEFKYLLDTLQTNVIWKTKLDRYPSSGRWQFGIPLFFVGGGIYSSIHRASVEGRDGWLREQTNGKAGVWVEALPAPENLEHPECPDELVQRLAVAIGLSLPSSDIPEAALPDAIPDIPRAGRVPVDDNFIGKDQV